MTKLTKDNPFVRPQGFKFDEDSKVEEIENPDDGLTYKFLRYVSNNDIKWCCRKAITAKIATNIEKVEQENGNIYYKLYIESSHIGSQSNRAHTIVSASFYDKVVQNRGSEEEANKAFAIGTEVNSELYAVEDDKGNIYTVTSSALQSATFAFNDTELSFATKTAKTLLDAEETAKKANAETEKNRN